MKEPRVGEGDCVGKIMEQCEEVFGEGSVNGRKHRDGRSMNGRGIDASRATEGFVDSDSIKKFDIFVRK